MRPPRTAGGYRFALTLRDAEPADPGAFITAIPTWRVGDEFIAGDELRKFRILAIVEGGPGPFDAVWVVEPI